MSVRPSAGKSERGAQTEDKPFVDPSDLGAFDAAEQLGEPGSFPYTRGPHRTMYRDRLWTMRQFAGFATAEETNERYKYLLAHGQTGLSVAFDFPTLMGYDSDHARSLGEVGVCGVAISSLDDIADRVETPYSVARRILDGLLR